MNTQVKDRSQVWVWVEHYRGEIERASLGILGKAHELCQQLGGGGVASVLIGDVSPQMVARIMDYGSSKVYLARDTSLSLADTELCAHFMSKLIQSYQPEVVLWGATSLGRETAARVAARLKTGLTAHCIDLFIEKINGEKQLVAVVAGWGGNMSLKIICPERRPQMATIKAGIFPPPRPNHVDAEVIPVSTEAEASRLDIIELVEGQEEQSSLSQAATVVVGGWGLKSLGGFAMVEELARILEGGVAGTRPALDAGWVSAGRMIGQSGITIAPQLLFTLGVSGAAQFATGVLNSKFIVAVDNNPNAPIFEMADIGMVGDLREVLPLLINKLKAIKSQT